MDRFFKKMLKELYVGYKSKNIKRIKKVETKCTEELVLGFNNDLFKTSVLSIMLSKLISKDRFSHSKYLLEMDKVMSLLKNHMNANDYIGMRKIVGEMIKLIDTVDSKDKKYIYALEHNAKVKIGAKLYAQGLSLSTASKLTKIDKFKILNYVGQTLMADRVDTYKPITQRIKEIKSIFI